MFLSITNALFFIHSASIVSAKCQGAGNINNLRLWGAKLHPAVQEQTVKSCLCEQCEPERAAMQRLPGPQQVTMETGTLGICKTEEGRNACKFAEITAQGPKG